MIIGSSKNIYKSFTIKALFLLLENILTNGLVMLSQQMFVHYVPDGNVSVFSFLSFGIVGVASMLMIKAFA